MFDFLNNSVMENRTRNKKTVRRLLDKYGTLDNFMQNSTMTEDLEYKLAQGDSIVDEVERERQAMMKAMNSLPKQQGSSLDDNDMMRNARANQYRNSLLQTTHDSYLFSNPLPPIGDRSILKQYANNQLSSTQSDVSVENIGSVSAKHESSHNPKAIGNDKGGGYSYGKYQIETKNGTMLDYIQYLKSKLEYKEYANILNNSGGHEGAKNRSEAFINAWELLSKDTKFNESQRQFILEKKLMPILNFTKKIKGFNVENRHPAIKEMLYSLATQHGNNGGIILLQNAIGRDITNMSDDELVNKIYDERSKVDKYFSRQTINVRKNIKTMRLPAERRDILRLLNN